MAKKNKIRISQIGAIVAALAIIMYLVGFNFAGGLSQNGEKLYTIEGQAHIAGQLFEPNIDVQSITYSMREAGFLDFNIASSPAMSIFDVAENVQCRAVLMQGNSQYKSAGYTSMGNFGTFTDKDYSFKLAKVPSGSYTLKVECNWKDGGYNKKEQEITIG